MTIHLTHGAKKNVGDFLIHSRARKLWQHFAPGFEVVSIPRWTADELPLDSSLLIMCGGPGLTPRMLEGVFPVAQRARDNGIPLSGLALGWQGLPKRNPASFAMTARSVSVLREIVANGAPISVRDDVTQEIAALYGIETVRTGCSAWYSLSHLGQPPANNAKEPRSIVYTTPALSENTAESIEVMRMLARRFRGERLIASFHRGIIADALTTRAQSRPLRKQARAARSLGFEVVDVSYDLANTDFYLNADLHIGYRVHAHLDFVSRRRPSLLISEDGRGFGQSATLHGPKSVIWAGHEQLVNRLERRLDHEVARSWPSLDRAIETIEETLPLMQSVIERQAEIAAN